MSRYLPHPLRVFRKLHVYHLRHLGFYRKWQEDEELLGCSRSSAGDCDLSADMTESCAYCMAKMSEDERFECLELSQRTSL